VGRGSPHVPKKEIRSGAGGELAIRCSKIEHCELNPCPICVAFGEIDRGGRPAGGGIFSYSYFADFYSCPVRTGQCKLYIYNVRTKYHKTWSPMVRHIAEAGYVWGLAQKSSRITKTEVLDHSESRGIRPLPSRLPYSVVDVGRLEASMAGLVYVMSSLSDTQRSNLAFFPPPSPPHKTQMLVKLTETTAMNVDGVDRFVMEPGTIVVTKGRA